MRVVPVHTKKQCAQFMNLPYHLYENDPLWIPPLRLEQKKLFIEAKNMLLQQSPYQFYLAMEGDTCIGRVAVFIDEHFNDYWNDKIGFFGSFECIDDQQVASALMRECETWLKERGLSAMRGPVNFESQNWGLICDHFDKPPRIMAAYNPPFYNDLLLNYGFSKIKDLEVFSASVADYVIPERFQRHKERLMQKYDLTIRAIRMKKMIEDVRIILDLNNRSVAGNWGVAPVSLEEADSIAKSLKDIVRPDLILIIESKGEPIAFLIVLPELYNALKGLNGRLLPFGIFKLMFRLKKINEFRFWALGVVPEFQRRGIDSLLYLTIYETLHSQNVTVEANYILEDNFAMKDAVIKLGMNKVRTYRVYEKRV
jgi:GNAT superfamily N-acetyltransferase